MAINEIFPNPTVKKVMFQIRFSHLFSLGNLIGEYQTKIMEEFPTSKLVHSKGFVFAAVGPESKTIEVPKDLEEERLKTTWSFESETGVALNVETDSLGMSSTMHKTYDNPKGKHRFRDSIQYAVDKFLEITQIPKITRIGLRYID